MPYVEFGPTIIHIYLGEGTEDDWNNITDSESICRAIDLLINKLTHFKHNDVEITNTISGEDRLFFHILSDVNVLSIYEKGRNYIRIKLFDRPSEPDDNEVDLYDYKILLESLKPKLCHS